VRWPAGWACIHALHWQLARAELSFFAGKVVVVGVGPSIHVVRRAPETACMHLDRARKRERDGLCSSLVGSHVLRPLL
jgi:hypothetical protein